MGKYTLVDRDRMIPHLDLTISTELAVIVVCKSGWENEVE